MSDSDVRSRIDRLPAYADRAVLHAILARRPAASRAPFLRVLETHLVAERPVQFDRAAGMTFHATDPELAPLLGRLFSPPSDGERAGA